MKCETDNLNYDKIPKSLNNTKENSFWQEIMELKPIYQIIFIVLILILLTVIVYLIIKFKGSVSHEKKKLDISKDKTFKKINNELAKAHEKKAEKYVFLAEKRDEYGWNLLSYQSELIKINRIDEKIFYIAYNLRSASRKYELAGDEYVLAENYLSAREMYENAIDYYSTASKCIKKINLVCKKNLFESLFGENIHKENSLLFYETLRYEILNISNDQYNFLKGKQNQTEERYNN